MRLQRISILVLLCGLLTGTCYAGPFGFYYGETRAQVIAEIGASHVLKSDQYSINVSTAPRPHSGFEEYFLVFSPTKGLLKIRAIGKNIETNTRGDQLQEEFHRIESSLSEIYGIAKTLDHLAAGSIWNEPRDWMEGMVKKDRELFSIWDSGDKIRAEHLAGVVLEAKALNSVTGYLDITYEFDGWDELSDQIKRERDKVF